MPCQAMMADRPSCGAAADGRPVEKAAAVIGQLPRRPESSAAVAAPRACGPAVCLYPTWPAALPRAVTTGAAAPRAPACRRLLPASSHRVGKEGVFNDNDR